MRFLLLGCRGLTSHLLSCCRNSSFLSRQRKSWCSCAPSFPQTRETPVSRARCAREALSRNISMTIRSSIEQTAKSVFGLAPGAEGSGDILDTLHEEHEEVQELLGRLNDSDDSREQKSLVNRIAQALVPHTKAE